MNTSACHSEKFHYFARKAQLAYIETLKSSREGISLSSDEMRELDMLVSPLLLKGQSIDAVFTAHKDEIPCSKTTLYNYVNSCYLTARNIDMPRKVCFKPRYSHGSRPESFQTFVQGRTYKDYRQYMIDNPDVNAWQMDTVMGGNNGRKCLFTLLHETSNFMLAYLLDRHTQGDVVNALNNLCETFGIDRFKRLFDVILTDRGVEFENPYALECDGNGEIKTKVFYCDPYCSWQKGKIERNHEFIREIIPKGKDFDRFTQADIHLMMTHINNYPRASLNNSTPYDLAKLLLGTDFLKALHFHKIPQDHVVLKPKLLWEPDDIVND
ncbi:MAG: IS30 family transposase [Lachnospiraceae bacterium]|nr:IS30 family transposase [Lachnospiraceae bacterium]